MAKQYGPWATSIDAGMNPQLNTFWRRRLTMLVPTSQTSPVLSRRNVLWLGAAAAILMVLPTFQSVGAAEDKEKPLARIRIEIDVNSPASEKSGKDAAVVRVERREVHKEQTAARKEPKKGGPKPWTLANDGTTMWEGSMSSGKPFNKEISKLIAEKKYKFVSTFDSPSGEKQWVYSFKFSDGTSSGANFSMPLDNVTSWEDYGRKQQQQRRQRHEKINEAIAAGRFRLLNVDALQVHLCRDVKSGKEFKVQRIPRAGDKDIAILRPDFSKMPPSVKETTWREHLKLIHDGKRQLLDLEVVNNYTYEMTANDGAKLIFNYGGNEPLKMPEKEAEEEPEGE